ncbi:Ribonuclease BN [Candidatus Rhabdochlamydia oedothoracis]|uniref:Ribonuclease Z n=1 Tax=Candidatus Rhabdochlamydia oedothoracis TaxID=2720720 RepID=A0ABX8V4E1_9BACT|nr:MULTISPECIES: ribonuclease Z [Rhabdochlamydia]KAG6559100.1 Ribonuclease BN [Candidatus Rhabdochlamydia sp. W815]MCL6756473.1 ribonuclease Z [Candidatus Rhabdochlamydia oedothoracis]QYF48335.1 Ribonuclease BN [Candidatus Rhabdochlamydia oedothoracis]
MSQRCLVILGCSSQQHTRTRNHGAYLLLWKTEGFLFDPGEGTQRQFIFANVAPTSVTRIFISHFHGDHCLGLGSMLMRLNLDKVTHPVHCYYPASGQTYFERLRYGSIYHQQIEIVEHPVFEEGVVHEDEQFLIQARFLEHGVDNLAWRVIEKDQIKFDQKKLQQAGIFGPNVRLLKEKKELIIQGKKIKLEDVSWVRKGDVVSIAIDTLVCPALVEVADHAKLFLCESTYLEAHRHLAGKHHHLTSKQAAKAALEAHVDTLVLTHFSARYQDLNEFLQEASVIFPRTIVAEDLKVIPF